MILFVTVLLRDIVDELEFIQHLVVVKRLPKSQALGLFRQVFIVCIFAVYVWFFKLKRNVGDAIELWKIIKCGKNWAENFMRPKIIIRVPVPSLIPYSYVVIPMAWLLTRSPCIMNDNFFFLKSFYWFENILAYEET